MADIKNYILGILLVSLSSGLIQTFAPEGGMKKYIKYIVSLTVVLTLLMPFSGLLMQLPSKLDSVVKGVKTEDYKLMQPLTGEEILINYTADKISENLKYEIKRKFGYDSKVMLEIDPEDINNIKIEKINILLTDSNADTSAVELYVSAVMMTKTEVMKTDG